MNWMRTILDGFAMAAYFNLFAAAVALYNPRLMFPSYPPAIIRSARNRPQKRRIAFTGYGFKVWMKSYALPEHLLQWPLLLCPLMAAVQAGIGVLLMRLLI